MSDPIVFTNFGPIDTPVLKIGGVTVVSVTNQAAVVAALTEGGSTLGGTNDGNIPDLTAGVGAAVSATVGANIAAFTDPPSAAEMAALRTFVNALKADNATLIARVNSLITDNVALRAGIREVAAKENATLGSLKTGTLMASS